MANSLKITHGLILDFTLPAAGVSDNFLAVDVSGSPTYFASIPVARIAPQTANRAATFNGSGFLAPSATTLTELGYVSGVTSAIQTQLNNKQSLIALTINRAVVSDGIGALTVSATTATEIGYVNGVTSAIQAQLDAKQATITGGASSIVSANLTVNRALMSDGSGKVIVSTVTATELGYSSGVTSAIQSQINGKLTVTVTTPASGDVVTYNGAAWVNSASAAQGVPVGGTAGQYLNKINGTNYNTQWSTLILSKITDVTSTAAEVNLLHGVTASTVQFNYLNTTTSNVQSQLNAKLNNNLSQNALWVGNASGVPAELSPGTSGYVLTSVGGVPAWQPAPGGGGGITSGGTSTDKAIVRWNSVLGTVVQDSVVVISNAGLITGGTWNGNKIGLTYGGTNADLSATGGAGQYLKQVTGGANITVGTIPASDIASGAALSKVDDTNVTLTLGGGFATALLSASSLTLGWTSTLAYARFVNGAGLSVVGRATNSSGVQADITAGSDADVLRRSGTSIGFGTIGDASITALAWSKITGTPTTLAGYGITDAATKTWALNPQAASYTFVITDADSKLTQATSASATNFIIPPNASVAFPIGSELPLVWDGTGQPSFVAGAGVTINSSSGDLTVPSRYSVAVAVKAATNTWYLWNGAAFPIQSARTFLAGPLTGAAATPTFRTLASTDIIATDASGVLTNNGAGVLTWAASAGAGTVTSVGWSTSQGVSASIANPTTTPNITITLGALTGVTSLNGLIVTANTGVITTGTWNATVIAGLYGGTGVANSGKTITLGGNLTTSGAFNTTFAVTGTNTITFPNASITVARQDAAQTLTGVQTFSSNIVLPNQAANTVMAGPTSGGGATPTFRALVAADIPSGVSITNTAAVNELMMSNGTNAVPSGLYADATGNLTLGNGLAGASRFINALGTAADISISSSAKGLGTYTITGNAVTIGGGSFTTIAVGAVSLLGNSSTGSGNAGGDLKIISGPGVTGNANSGNIFIDNAAKVGSGIVGSVSFFKQTADYGGGSKVIYIGNATTSPTTNPTGGGIMFVKSSDNKPYWRTPAGVETVMLGSGGGGGGITNTAAANEMMKSDGTNAVPSGIFSTTAGELIFGTGLTGADRTFLSDGSATDVGYIFNTKGSGTIKMFTNLYQFGNSEIRFFQGATTGILTFYGTASNTIGATGPLIIGNIPFGGAGGYNVELRGNSRSSGTGVVADLIIQGGASAVTTMAGGNLFLLSGAPSVGNADSGNIYIDIPAPIGTGIYGNIGLFTQAGTFGTGERVVFWHDATTNPTTNPTSGGIMFVKSADHKPYWRTPAGVETVMLDGSAGSDWTLASGGTLTGANTITGTTTNTIKFAFANLGTTFTRGAGLAMTNATAAAAGAQQISPIFSLVGQGWKTNATAGSQEVAFHFRVLPVQGAANPTSQLIISNQINAATVNDRFFFNDDGALNIINGSQAIYLSGISNSIDFGNGSAASFKTNGSTRISITSNGQQTITQTAQSATNTFITWTQAVHTGGSPTGWLFTGGAHTTLATTAEATTVNFNISSTVQWAAGTVALQRFGRWQSPTMAFVSASTTTRAVSFAIGGPVKSGANATITDDIGLEVETRDVSGGTAVTRAYAAWFNAPSGASTNWALKTVGGVNMNTLPTSSAGLVAGDIWNNSGVLNIV